MSESIESQWNEGRGGPVAGGMRAIQALRYGGPEVLEEVEVEVPRPGPGQVLVQVAAAGVNYTDVYRRSGLYAAPLPLKPGLEGAGTVIQVGPGVREPSVGQRVGWVSAPGSYAERVVVEAERAIPLPDAVSDELAAASLLQGLTAHYLCTSTYPVRDGDVVLVHAAAGGVGLLLTQMVRMRGGRVIATTSSPAKAALAAEAGADHVIGYDGFADRVRELTDGEGVAAVYDGVGRSTFDASLAALRRRGILVLFGAASGPVPPVDPMRLNAGSLFLTRPTLVDYTATREELMGRASDLFAWIAEGRLRVRVGGRYPLSEAARAHRDLEGRATTGKLLLLP